MQVQVPMQNPNEAATRLFCCNDSDSNAGSSIASQLHHKNKQRPEYQSSLLVENVPKVKGLYSTLFYTSRGVLSTYLA